MRYDMSTFTLVIVYLVEVETRTENTTNYQPYRDMTVTLAYAEASSV